MKNYYEVIAVSSGGEQLELVKSRQGVRVYPIKMSRKITPLKDFIALIKLVVFLRKEKPFIVHTHTPKAGTLGIIAALIARVPHRLHTVAGMPLLEAAGMKRILLDMVEKITYLCATQVYPNSHGLKKIILENNYTNPSKIDVILNGSSNGINTWEFSASAINSDNILALQKTLELADSNFIFCYIGRMVKDKGVNELVEAFVEFYSENKHSSLILVGPFENDLDPLLPSAIQAINTHPGIRFVGLKNDVRPYLSICDVVVFPSYREGFPNVVMQAGAMGKPCIVTDINGCNEIIIDGINGLIIPPKKTSAILAAMRQMIIKPEMRLRMQNNARHMIVSRYEQMDVWKALLTKYQELETESYDV